MARWYAVVGAIVISFSAIFVRLADVSPSTSAFFRPAYGLPFLAVAALVFGGSSRRSLRERATAVCAGTLMGAAFTLWHYAIPAIGSGLSTVLGNTQVVIVGLFGWWAYGERPSRAALYAIPVVLLGVLATSGVGAVTSLGSAPVRGAVYGLVNGVFYAGFLVLFRSLQRGRGVPFGTLADATFGAAAFAWIVGWWTDPAFDLRWAWPAHGWLLAAGVGPQVLGWTAILYALPRLPGLETSIILLLQPVLTTVWAAFLLAEYPSWLQLVGVALVLAGVAVVSVRGAVARNLRPSVGRTVEGGRT